jgi:hypothetical protein
MRTRNKAGFFEVAVPEPEPTTPLDKAQVLQAVEAEILGALDDLRADLAAQRARLRAATAPKTRENASERISRQARELTHLIRALKAHGVPIEAPPPEESEFEKRMRMHQADVRREARRLRRAAKKTEVSPDGQA